MNTYGYTLQKHSLGKYGLIDYAHWDHPFEGDHEFSEIMVDEYRHWITPGSLVVDIGAHSGDTAIPLAAATGKNGMVLAFEPNIHVFQILLANSRLNPHLAPIIPLPFAVTPKRGRATFHYVDDAFCNGGDMLTQYEVGTHGNRCPLDVCCLDLGSFIPIGYQTLSFIKIDIEGSENILLWGMRGLLALYKPCLQVEIWNRTTPAMRLDLFLALDTLGYEMWVHRTDRVVKADMLNELETFDLDCRPKR